MAGGGVLLLVLGFVPAQGVKLITAQLEQVEL